MKRMFGSTTYISHILLPTAALGHQAWRYLAGLLADLDPVKVAMFGFVHNVPATVKAQDVVADTACPSRLFLMLMTK